LLLWAAAYPYAEAFSIGDLLQSYHFAFDHIEIFMPDILAGDEVDYMTTDVLGMSTDTFQGSDRQNPIYHIAYTAGLLHLD
jgi:hypothetical protein